MMNPDTLVANAYRLKPAQVKARQIKNLDA